VNLRRKRLVTATAVIALACSGAAYAVTGDHAGPQGDGTSVTPVGFRVTPAGRQAVLGLLPLASALSPDGSRLLISNNGQGVQSLQVADTATGTVTQTLEYKQPEALFVGVAWSPDGKHAYASAGGNNKIRVYDVSGGTLTEGQPLKLPTTNPAGTKINMFPAGLAVSADGTKLYVADQLADAVSVIDVASGAVKTAAVGHNPYGVTLSRDGKTAYVTNQGENTVSVVDVTGDPKTTGTITVGTHPSKAALSGSRLYVAASDSDEVDAVDTATGRLAGRIDLRPYRGAPVGSNPVAVTPSADGRLLYVANSGNNDVAVVDTHRGRVIGTIPTGWYPTSVQLHGNRLFVTNAKGLGAGPNNGPGQPDPTDPAGGSPDKYVGSMIKGSLSVIDGPGDRRNLTRWSRQVVSNNGFDERDKVRAADGGHVIPLHPGEHTPIKHVIYVVRENRTFDQEYGSLGKGNGDPSINLFGDESAPNSRAIARKFTTLDNFYADAEVSAQGWNWSVAGNSNPYVEASWPANYSGRNRPYDYEGGNPATAPGRDYRHSYIWNKLADNKVSFRNYGFYTDAAGNPDPIDPSLPSNTDTHYPGFDLSKQDHCDAQTGVGRMCEWLKEFKGYEQSGNLPTFEFVRLPNDHTAGTNVGSPTPKAYVADNDYALGQLVDTISHSKYWKETAVFVVEDDAQNGPDHIDAHRTVAMVASPYTQAGRVDSTFYSTVSMLRTMELLAGVGPMTQFDAYATPMVRSFTARPDFAPFTALLPQQSFDEKNPKNAPMADISARQRLGKEDQIDERTFSEAVWKSVKGAHSQMPAPQHLLPVLPPTDGD
jgi:YVTN family beta-propeller protein